MTEQELQEIEHNLSAGTIETWQDIRPSHVRALINEVRRLRKELDQCEESRTDYAYRHYEGWRR
jgi:hypothetical protein